ncbi:MAG TPA: transcription antitermination factor NusB [Candidatus Borkfalkia excrementigallinarum]|uniref:Transcription antitermination factor NusB n=1 Tax=Candidatus Borkfalkia excrementigallinarum TaxID=2838506 RepID=A0A9D1ZVT4_9FIRM|nr:transcription antitermination factor NusB [Candidatus Borkfalkia excrementigallinarum]
MRNKARECAFKIIFASLFHEEDEPSSRGMSKAFGLEELDEEETGYTNKLVALVQEHKDELIGQLDKYSIGFSEKRLFPADKSLLLMAMAEMKYVDEVPDIVAIDEAVGLAKKYSTERSAGFVNGVLAAYLNGGKE